MFTTARRLRRPLQRTHTLVLLFLLCPAAVRAQTSTAHELAAAFAQPWNNHDIRAFGELYAADADWVMAGGIRHKSRVVIQAALEREHATWAGTTTLRATDVVVRPVGSDHAIVTFAWEIARASDRTTTSPPIRGARYLPNARHLVVANHGHPMGTLAECANRFMADFIEAGSARDLDVSCANDIQAPPFVTAELRPTQTSRQTIGTAGNPTRFTRGRRR